MNAKERALLRACAGALNEVTLCFPPRITPAEIAALQQRIREALAKKGKRK